MRMAVILMMMVLATGCQTDRSGSKADLILTGGQILTQAETTFPSPPSAVAVAGGKILAVGSDARVLETKGPQTKVVDLNGATVIPGLVDSHCHLYGLGKSLGQIDLMGTESTAADDRHYQDRRHQVRRRRLDRRPRLGPERLGNPGISDSPDAGRDHPGPPRIPAPRRRPRRLGQQ